MGRKVRKDRRELQFDPYEDFDDDIDIKDLARDFYSTERDDYYSTDSSFTARRKIERHRDMKKLYSQLDDWEEFGEHADW